MIEIVISSELSKRVRVALERGGGGMERKKDSGTKCRDRTGGRALWPMRSRRYDSVCRKSYARLTGTLVVAGGEDAPFQSSFYTHGDKPPNRSCAIGTCF